MPPCLDHRPRLLRTLAALLAVPLALVAGGCHWLAGNGDLEIEERELVGFDAVTNATELDVEITIGEAESVRVACDSNLLGRVETSVAKGALRIDSAGLLSLRGCRVEVELAHLRAVDNHGSGDVQTFGEASELTQIHQFGSGSITVDELTAPTVDVRSTGSGSVALAGKTGDATFESTGSGGIHARELRAKTVVARSTGSGGLELFASEVVDAELTGSGDIHVWGKPGDRVAISEGSGEVVFH